MFKVENIRTVYGDADFGNAILFTVNGREHVEYLDSDGDLEITDSHLDTNSDFDSDEIAEIRSHLRARRARREDAFELFWVSKDKQGEYPGGEYPSYDAAVDAAGEFLGELLGQCSEVEERESILAGSFLIIDTLTDERRTLSLEEVKAA